VVVPVLRESLRIFSARGARFLAAGVAFYALLSAAPLFVVILHVVSAVFGRPRAESALWEGLSHWLAPEGIATVRALTERFEAREGGIVGVALVIYGSTRLFRALRRALNQLWGVDLEAVERARPSHVKYGVRYGGALALTFFVTLLVAALVVVKTAIALAAALGARPPSALLWGIDAGSSVVLAFALFFALFRFLPETRVTTREAATSAFVSTALFAAGSAVVSIYLRHKQASDLYAGAAALVLVVLWAYYSAQVFFFGASVGAALRQGSTR
jgi:membrane protein